jgi:hypothetical protein
MLPLDTPLCCHAEPFRYVANPPPEKRKFRQFDSI